MLGGSVLSDTSEGRTLFIRNLSFDVDHDALYEFFASFGPLEFAKVVKDPSTSHSRGTGFVKFTRPEDAAHVLSESNKIENTSRFTLDGRAVYLSMAVSRQEAERLRNAKKETSTVESTAVPCSMAERLRQQGRNLHLARVGMIRAGTVAAEGLSKEDLAKREALLRSKKSKLQNPNIFISDVRLCVRNLPLTVSDEDLRRVCLDFLGAGSKRCLTECRVMRNLQPGKQQFRSLGYAFISFTKHEDALKILHHLNNNAEVFPNQRRPIVEFSLENMQALEKKRRRAEKCAAIQAKRNLDGTRLQVPSKLVSACPTNKPAQQPVIKRLKKGSASVGTRVLPKRLGIKKRHRARSSSTHVGASKPKKHLSRKQIRARKKM
ncbi:hypothetical protein P879_04330 [Paragonimus westermani]|uniref:RRM domain-containing protein n=1 Tax=Paragonimus westermani TaxID=34504 RepID=A0A8T0D2Y1_9TREM|nr:hypothetical protein P879_04330 [Paragonimus westermani]